ncbi:MAG: response regulator, partial [Sediminibacterium sp.]|nr:response regulator [Sediminibacterium sp.]
IQAGKKKVKSVRIQVLDTGKGIASEHLNHIFDRFYQVPESMNRAGTGVGLSLCKELIELHLGQIEVNSKLGEGSNFSITFPVQDSVFDPSWIHSHENLLDKIVSNNPVVRKLDSIEHEKQILLIVDDHTELRKFVADIFSDRFQIVESERGEEALELALKFLPDVVITDWMMPGMSGINLCRALRSNPKTNHIPIIILTSKSSQDSQIEGMQSGADDYVSKPISPKVLVSRVNALFRRVNSKDTGKTIKIANIQIDPVKFNVIIDEQEVVLAKKEFELLYLLASRPGRVFLRNEILSQIWGNDVIVGDRTIDVHIRKVRQKLGVDCITTVKGVGYKFEL